MDVLILFWHQLFGLWLGGRQWLAVEVVVQRGRFAGRPDRPPHFRGYSWPLALSWAAGHGWPEGMPVLSALDASSGARFARRRRAAVSLRGVRPARRATTTA